MKHTKYIDIVELKPIKTPIRVNIVEYALILLVIGVLYMGLNTLAYFNSLDIVSIIR